MPILKKLKSDVFTPHTLLICYNGEMHSETQVFGLKNRAPSLTNTEVIRLDMYIWFIHHNILHILRSQ
jgi:hypothetical protein